MRTKLTHTIPALLAAALTASASAQYTFQSYQDGNLPLSALTSINDRGQIGGEAISSATNPTNVTAYMLSGPSLSRSDLTLNGEIATAIGLNNSGSRVGRIGAVGPDRTGYRFHKGTVTLINGFPGFESEVWANPGLGGARSVFPQAINERGTTVGAFLIEVPVLGPVPYGFVLSGEHYEQVSVPGAASFTNVWDAVVGGPVPPVPPGYMPGRWDAPIAYATGINNRGVLCGAFIANAPGFPTMSYVYDRGVYTIFHLPAGATVMEARGINDAGVVAGTLVDANGVHAYVISGGVLTIVDVPGSDFTQLGGINNRGQLVGRYFVASGESYGFIATPE